MKERNTYLAVYKLLESLGTTAVAGLIGENLRLILAYLDLKGLHVLGSPAVIPRVLDR